MEDQALETLIFPESILSLKKLETVLTLVLNYFKFSEEKGLTLENLKQDLTRLKNRVTPKEFWGKKHQADEALILANIALQEILNQGEIPSVFGWVHVIVEALTDPETPKDSDKNWGVTKTSYALAEIRHFAALLG